MDLKLFSGATEALTGLVGSVGSAIDKNVTSDEERLKLRNELQNILVEYDKSERSAVTAIHAADMMSDSKLSKNVRPVLFITVIFMFFFFAYMEGIGWIVLRDSYVSAIAEITYWFCAFYVGGRTTEKSVSFLSSMLGKKK